MEKQIEEMAKCMANCENTCDECFEKLERVMAMKIKNRKEHCQAYMFATRVVEQGYRKFPEGSVVLSMEEIGELKCQVEEDCNKSYDLGSKETAEKILKDLWDNQFETTITIQHNSSKEDIENVGKAIITSIRNKLVKLAKQFGVEVEE